MIKNPNLHLRTWDKSSCQRKHKSSPRNDEKTRKKDINLNMDNSRFL